MCEWRCAFPHVHARKMWAHTKDTQGQTHAGTQVCAQTPTSTHHPGLVAIQNAPSHPATPSCKEEPTALIGGYIPPEMTARDRCPTAPHDGSIISSKEKRPPAAPSNVGAKEAVANRETHRSRCPRSHRSRSRPTLQTAMAIISSALAIGRGRLTLPTLPSQSTTLLNGSIALDLQLKQINCSHATTLCPAGQAARSLSSRVRVRRHARCAARAARLRRRAPRTHTHPASGRSAIPAQCRRHG